MEKVDRRVKYTKDLLRDALVELLLDTHISKISVTKLCEVADVHRSTFYTHYKDQFDLLDQIQLEVLDNIKLNLEKQSFNDLRSITEQKLVKVLDYGKKNPRLVLVLLSDSSTETFRSAIVSYVNLISFSGKKNYSSEMKEYIASYCVSGTISIINQWLRNEMKESTTEIAHLIIQLTRG
ncbi:MAG: TetR/AcrR family transcriptional regulator [Dysgonomonas sp.]